jgi:hypothetical protein
MTPCRLIRVAVSYVPSARDGKRVADPFRHNTARIPALLETSPTTSPASLISSAVEYPVGLSSRVTWPLGDHLTALGSSLRVRETPTLTPFPLMAYAFDFGSPSAGSRNRSANSEDRLNLLRGRTADIAPQCGIINPAATAAVDRIRFLRLSGCGIWVNGGARSAAPPKPLSAWARLSCRAESGRCKSSDNEGHTEKCRSCLDWNSLIKSAILHAKRSPLKTRAVRERYSGVTEGHFAMGAMATALILVALISGLGWVFVSPGPIVLPATRGGSLWIVGPRAKASMSLIIDYGPPFFQSERQIGPFTLLR